jgi:hypothetical protein
MMGRFTYNRHCGWVVPGAWFLSTPGGTELGEDTIQIRTVGLVQSRDSRKKEFDPLFLHHKA